jgi:hypothetical protein
MAQFTDGVWLQGSLSMGVIRKVVKGLEFAAGLAGRAGWDDGGFDLERVRMGAV